MKCIVTILLVVVISTAGRAGEWKAFVGYGGVMDIPTRVDYWKSPFGFETTPLYVCAGTQFELGIRKKNHEFYAGFHFSGSRWNESWSGRQQQINDSTWRYTSYENKNAWHERRVLLGYRFHPQGSSFVSPIVGAGIGIGQTEKRYHDESYTAEFVLDTLTGGMHSWRNISSMVTETSNYPPLNVGVLIEAGVSLHIKGSADVIVLAQMHGYVERYPSWFGMTDWEDILIPSFVVQARYTFGK
jgi:hypothetical protein